MDRDLLSFLDWEPDDEDRSGDAAMAAYQQAREQLSGGDSRAALGTLDRGLEAAGLDNRTDAELAVLLGAKAMILIETGRHDEALVLFNRLLEVTEDGEELLHPLNVLSRVGMALLLAEQGQREEALAALSNVASAYASEDDPRIRAAGVSALTHRIRELAELGRFEAARAEWLSLRASHGADPEPKVRAEVASGGKTATILFVDRRRYRLALKTADEVMALYRTETDPEIRAAVALTMWSRLTALRRRLRLVGFWRGSQDLMRYIGSEPEPELVEAIRDAHPRGEAVLRHARVLNG